MLAEVLLVLSRHPSSFFVPDPPHKPATLKISETLSAHLHPGEVASLNKLGHLAYQYTFIRDWAKAIKSEGRRQVLEASIEQRRKDIKGKSRETHSESNTSNSVDLYLSTLAASILGILREYEILLVDIESKILNLDEGLVQDQFGYVPLSTLIATFSLWDLQLIALIEFINNIPSNPGEIMDLLNQLSNNGNPRIHYMFSRLLFDQYQLFLNHLLGFILYGIAPSSSTQTSPAFGIDAGPDPLNPQYRIYKLNNSLIPSSIREDTRESILYIGRVTSTLKGQGRELPKPLLEGLRKSILSSTDSISSTFVDLDLDESITKTRSEIGEWLWRNILTSSQITESINSFSNYFCTRKADFSISLLRELHSLYRKKFLGTNPHSSSSVIREQDLNTAILRASVGTSVEMDKDIDKLRYKLPLGIIRPSSSTKPTRSEEGIRGLFSNSILGQSAHLTSNITWPLDLFMTPMTMSNYTDIHTFLMAIRDTHLKVTTCWSNLSASQRRRRKWTGINEGGSAGIDLPSRRRLLRSAWGIVRAMLFFLDELLGHFMTDVIDVQHKKLLSQIEELQEGSDQSKGIKSGSIRTSTRPTSPDSKYRTPTRTLDGNESIGESTRGETQTVRSRIPPSARSKKTYLDFLTLRQLHSRHLSSLREGLLLSDQSTATIIRDILDICRRFAGLMERWGGDVLPELLGDDEVGDRINSVDDVAETLHDLLCDFFRNLVESQNPTSGDSSGSTSLSRTSRTTQILQMQSSRIMSRQQGASSVNNKSSSFGRHEAFDDAMSGRHIEQLLLRLDFNRVLTNWLQKGQDGAMTHSVLAEGGL